MSRRSTKQRRAARVRRAIYRHIDWPHWPSVAASIRSRGAPWARAAADVVVRSWCDAFVRKDHAHCEALCRNWGPGSLEMVIAAAPEPEDETNEPEAA